MANEYDRSDRDNEGGGSFVMGLLTGTVLGAGLGMLFAPKAGSDLRNQMREQAGNLANSASDGYRRATETAGQYASRAAETASQYATNVADTASQYVDRGRDMAGDLAGRAREAVVKGAEEAQRYVHEATGASPSDMTERMAKASSSGTSGPSSMGSGQSGSGSAGSGSTGPRPAGSYPSGAADPTSRPSGSQSGSGGFGGSRS
jgi:gas vesicle protein